MKYIVVDDNSKEAGEIYTKEFATAEEAVNFADRSWSYLTNREKEKRVAFYVLESDDPDEDAPGHYDGTTVRSWK